MIDWLMRPRVRRFRRWSFVLTFPAAIVVARVFGIEDGVLLLASRRRVDVLLELSEPVRVQRPFHEPLETRTLGVASDDPEDLIRLLLAPAPRALEGWTLAWTLELAALARDAAQPG